MAELIRVQKFLSQHGVCSRREAELAIESGEVRVNGKVAQLGDKVEETSDQVFFRNRRILPHREERLVIAMNKPRGYICSHDDPHHEKTIFDLLSSPHNRRKLLIAGRLDKDSEGLVILTTDGEFANRLSHPRNQIVKRYQVRLNRAFVASDIRELLNGKKVDGEFLQADRVIPENRPGSAGDRIEIHLGHGKKREIRRLLEATGYLVKRLKRVQIGSFKLSRLPIGKSKVLSKDEIELLFEDPRA
ncbi:MAG: pseudouridine synthase [Puniceicoccaceae bacterium]